MQFTTTLFALAAAGLASAAPSIETRATVGTQTIKWDATYDNAGQSLSTVACSDGRYGLSHKWGSFGSIPYFNQGRGGWGVVASPDVGGWNSPSCGVCYSISYNGKNAWVVAVDHGAPSFNVGKNVMDYLTNGRAAEFGQIRAQVKTMQCPQYWK